MPEYYRHKKTGNKYKYLFSAHNKSDKSEGSKTLVIYTDAEGGLINYARKKDEFFSKFERCNPPADWQSLYNTKVVCLMDSLGYSEEAFRLIGKASFNKDYLDRYEEIKNKVLPYTLKRLERYN